MVKNILIILTISFFVSFSNNNTGEKKITEVRPIFNQIKPNTYMDNINTDQFWMLINSAVKVSNDNDSLKEQYLISQLSKLSLKEIHDFEMALRKSIIDADDFKVMAAQKIIEGYVSDDSYLYFHCWLIGQGKTVFSETLKNPDYLAKIVNKGDICEFEELLYITTEAFSKVTGKKEDDSFPRSVAYSKGLDYDNGAPPTKGTDWTSDQLPTLYPKLWTKLN
jgi:hypothetical protein